MTKEKALEELERIQKEFQEFRTRHGRQTALYITKKTEYQVKENEFVNKRLAENSTLKKTWLKEGFMDDEQDLFIEYRDAEAEMEGLDRSLKNLDAQRSIIQTILNQMEKK